MSNVIHQFYSAFQNLDAEEMSKCYHKEIHFRDPAFGDLHGESASNMWRMLLASQKGKDFKVTFSDVDCTETEGSAKWEAFYTFSKTGRQVHNKISAQFKIKDGLIVEHFDDFNLHQWSRQAMGISGLMIGWSGFFKKKLQVQTRSLLKKFESKH